MLDIIFAAFGGLLFDYDTGVIAGALLFMKVEWQLIPFTMALVTSSLFFCVAFVILTSRRLSDKIERQKITLLLFSAVIIYKIGSSSSTNVEHIVFFKIILGFGVGGIDTVAPIYIA